MSKGIRILLRSMPVFLLALFVVTAPAQTPPQNPTKAAPRVTPPDRQAYTAANAIKEPDKKIEALEKVINDFPDSTAVFSAYQSITDTLIKNYPDQKARILQQAELAISKASEAAKANVYSTIAGYLCDAGILLVDAEKFAAKGVELMDAAASQGSPNQQASMGRRKATSQSTLGRIYLAQGKLDAAEKSLNEALKANPQLTVASVALAEIYEKRGESDKALTTYINAAALGKIPASARTQLNSLYAKVHNGSMAGLEEALDAKYLEANPVPFEVEPYKPSDTRTNRVVLAEVFTGSGCPPCVAADLAADLALERYKRDELVVLMYHEHIPQPDPMTTPQTQARFKFYSGTGVPTLAIDGDTTVGGGARDAAKRVFDRITTQIEQGLETAAEAQLKLAAVRDGNNVKASVVVDKVTSDSSDLNLYIVLAEEKLRYTGENGVRFHPMVVRSMAGADGAQSLPLKTAGSQTFTWDFDLPAISGAIKKHLDEYEAGGHRGNRFTFTEKKSEINPKGLYVVAFVQDSKTKSILQSILVKVTP